MREVAEQIRAKEAEERERLEIQSAHIHKVLEESWMGLVVGIVSGVQLIIYILLMLRDIIGWFK